METDKDLILVLGANGKTGSRVAARLEELGFKVRRGSRTGIPRFNWDDRTTWLDSLDGITSVYITFQPDLAVPGAPEIIGAFVDAAKKSGVSKLVLLSGRGEPEARACEDLVIESGLQYTIVRASWFNQNFSEGSFLDPILAGHVALPAGDVKEPFIDAEDIADVVVAALTDKKHNNSVYEVTGPRLLTFKDIINEISSATGVPIEYEQITLDEYTAMLKEYQVPQDNISLISYLFSEVLDGRNASLADGVYQILGRKPKDFSEFILKTLKTRVWTR